jgi:DNA repair protein RecO (recombination protein O)
LADQLGSFSAELVHPSAATVMDDALLLSMLTSCCAVAEGVLIEREPQVAVFDGLLNLLARLPSGPAMMQDLIRWELTLLAALGFGLDLSVCAATGETKGLRLVSPRTGRAVSDAAAGVWRDRLLPLPAFLTQGPTGIASPASPQDWADGLRLAGHFLERDAFGAHHRTLPQARRALSDRVDDLIRIESETGVHE